MDCHKLLDEEGNGDDLGGETARGHIRDVIIGMSLKKVGLRPLKGWTSLFEI